MIKTKAVVFDAYGTLFDVNSAAKKCKDKIGAKWESFANFWRTTQLEYTWLRSLMKRHKNFWEVTEDSLDKSMKVFNIDKNMKNELLSLYKILSPYPEVRGVLEDLKKKNFKLAILSNGTPDLLNELVENNKLNLHLNLDLIENPSNKLQNVVGSLIADDNHMVDRISKARAKYFKERGKRIQMENSINKRGHFSPRSPYINRHNNLSSSFRHSNSKPVRSFR